MPRDVEMFAMQPYLLIFFIVVLTISLKVVRAKQDDKEGINAEQDEKEDINASRNLNLNCTGGKLLSKKVCLPNGYDKFDPPNETMIIFTDLNWANFREVDDKKMTITFDLLISYMWIDGRIKTGFSLGVEPIKQAFLHSIWRPGVYIENLKSYRQRSAEDKLKLEQLSIFKNNYITSLVKKDQNESFTFVCHRMETQITLYCSFVFDKYPMDTQTCIFKLGTSDQALHQPVVFKHYLNGTFCLTFSDTNKSGHALQDFDIETKCYQAHGSARTARFVKTADKDCAAFNITLRRTLRPFVMKYYLPCIAIVISSQISFLIPISALPGRTALIATLFLALINLFTAQQVSTLNILKA